jgi:hypothetical protein
VTVTRGLSDPRVIADGGVGCFALPNHDVQGRWGAHHPGYRLGDKADATDRDMVGPRSAASVGDERDLARPLQPQLSALHRPRRTSRITDPVGWASRPSRDLDSQRPEVLAPADWSQPASTTNSAQIIKRHLTSGF